MSYWLLLADPGSYGFPDLVRDKTTVWDGIAGSLAQKHMRAVRKGDEVLVYHTSPDKAVVGRARATSDPYPDPSDNSGKQVVIEVGDASPLMKPVALSLMRDNPALAGMAFLKIQRIAVSPLSPAEFREIVNMGT